MRRKSGALKKIKAFTLVELLVVISIIGLLAGLSVPAISAARASAQTAASTSNLKQIYTMLQTYLAENNNNYPASVTNQISWRRLIWESANGPLSPGGDWSTLTNNLSKGPYAKVMWCPLMTSKYGMDSYHPIGRGSYSINQYFNQSRNSLSLGQSSDLAGKNEPFIVAGGAERLIGTSEEFVSIASPNNRGRDGTAYEYGGSRNKALVMFLNGSVELWSGSKGNQIEGDVGNRDNFK